MWALQQRKARIREALVARPEQVSLAFCFGGPFWGVVFSLTWMVRLLLVQNKTGQPAAVTRKGSLSTWLAWQLIPAASQTFGGALLCPGTVPLSEQPLLPRWAPETTFGSQV